MRRKRGCQHLIPVVNGEVCAGKMPRSHRLRRMGIGGKKETTSRTQWSWGLISSGELSITQQRFNGLKREKARRGKNRQSGARLSWESILLAGELRVRQGAVKAKYYRGGVEKRGGSHSVEGPTCFRMQALPERREVTRKRKVQEKRAVDGNRLKGAQNTTRGRVDQAEYPRNYGLLNWCKEEKAKPSSKEKWGKRGTSRRMRPILKRVSEGPYSSEAKDQRPK